MCQSRDASQQSRVRWSGFRLATVDCRLSTKLGQCLHCERTGLQNRGLGVRELPGLPTFARDDTRASVGEPIVRRRLSAIARSAKVDSEAKRSMASGNVVTDNLGEA